MLLLHHHRFYLIRNEGHLVILHLQRAGFWASDPDYSGVSQSVAYFT